MVRRTDAYLRFRPVQARPLPSRPLRHHAFTEKAENIVLIAGTGKTHLATTLRVEMVTRLGKRVRFYSAIAIINGLKQEKIT